MTVPIYNHLEIYQFLYDGNTSQAIKSFVQKTPSLEWTPFLRNFYLSALNFGIYNYILINEHISLHECCMENERKIMMCSSDSFIDVGIDIISSYGSDSRYLIEKYTNPHIKAALLYIHQNLSEPLSLHTVSNAISLNPSYLSDLFKREAGINFNDYINLQRIKTAQKLLKNSSLSIQEISEQCGYKKFSYFSTCFKKITGQTASDYRRGI